MRDPLHLIHVLYITEKGERGRKGGGRVGESGGSERDKGRESEMEEGGWDRERNGGRRG